jgi:carbohydrate kinase (thermoresistant glucokinase family)
VHTGLYVVMGVCGAGKSLIGAKLAQELGVEFVEGDALHPPENVRKMAAGIPLTDEDRHGWLLAIAARFRDAKRSGVGMVAACSALKRKYRDLLRSAGDPGVRFIHLEGTRELLAERMTTRRGHFMPTSLLDSQLATLETPTPDEGAWVFDISTPPDVIVANLLKRATSAAAE